MTGPGLSLGAFAPSREEYPIPMVFETAMDHGKTKPGELDLDRALSLFID